MTIEIRGFKLPPLLEKLINDGKWVTNYDISIRIPQDILQAAGINDPVVVLLCGLNELRHHNTKAAWDDMASENYDVAKVVLIAYNQEDDIVCLDYRFNSNNPQVVIWDWVDEKWRVIAPDFDTFAQKSGLVK
jgi:hypothetical protein